MQVHRYIRTGNSGTLVGALTSASVGTISLNNQNLLTMTTGALGAVCYYGVGIGFTFSDSAGASDLAALYDQYRLVRVEVEMLPIANSALISGAAGGNADLGCWIHSITDLDDNVAPGASTTGITDMQQFRTYRCDRLVTDRKLKWTLANPHIAMAAYASGVFTSYANMTSQWIDANSGTVEHYGLKFLFEVFPTGSTVNYVNLRMVVKYYLEMRQQR